MYATEKSGGSTAAVVKGVEYEYESWVHAEKRSRSMPRAATRRRK